MSRSCSKQQSQTVVLVVEVIAWYFTLAGNQDIIGYFLDFHEIWEFPGKIKNLVVDHWVVGQFV